MASDRKPLSDKETKRLIAAAKAGDEKARETLVRANERLIWSVVSRFFNRGYEREDLFQIGSIGLLKAIDRFDESYGVKFSTYAVPLIMGEVKRFLRDDSPIKVSRSLKELAAKARSAEEDLAAELSREPTVSEIAARLGVTTEDLVTAYEACRTPHSIYETVFEDEGDPIYLADQLKDAGEGSFVENIAIRELLDRLPPRLRKIIILRYFEDKTQAEVAEIVGISQVQVSRLEKRTLKILKDHLAG